MSCSFFPEGCWSDCCKEHDIMYRVSDSKIKADKKLYRCIKAKNHRNIAVVVFLGVSLFGWIWWYKARLFK